MKICIIGGGNIGTALAAMVASTAKHEVVLQSSKPGKWSGEVYLVNGNDGNRIKGHLASITADYAQAVKNCDIVLIAQPSFMIQKTMDTIMGHLKENTIVGVVPGTGGAEFAAKSLLTAGHTLFGVDRVPCIARLQEYGREVIAYPKNSIRLCAIPNQRTNDLCRMVSMLFGINCFPVKNYLTITLTPSNPILHTARLSTLFQSHLRQAWERPPLFYGEWDDSASEVLLQCDQELGALCCQLSEIPLEVVPLKNHYEAETVQAMTQKLRSIPSLAKIESPMRLDKVGYIPNLQSRYFTEDIPFGLCIIKGFAAASGIPTPSMDRILHWYENLMGVQYFVGESYEGKDLLHTAAPQNFGITSKEKILRFYLT